MNNNEDKMTTRQIFGVNIEYEYMMKLEARLDALEAKRSEPNEPQVEEKQVFRTHKQRVCNKKGRIAKGDSCSCCD